MLFTAIAVPVPGLSLLIYRVPDHFGAVCKGARVLVPLGSRVVTGVVVEPTADAPAGAEIRDIVQLVDDRAFLPPVVVDLALWVGDYYASGPGDALAIAMPPAARQGRDAFRTVQKVSLTGSAADATVRGAKQQAAISLLRERPGLTLPEILKEGIGTSTIRSLTALGLVTLTEHVVERDPFAVVKGSPAGDVIWSVDAGSQAARALTREQDEALHHLGTWAAAGAFKTALLHGVTGSGKTEVYLQLARQVTDAGRRVLVLVPEIGLTPVVAGLFRARFGQRVAIQHSGLSEGERHDQWHRIRRGDVEIVIGTRSAVFAPLEQVGLIVVDEEHDGAYKQEEAPRYHGRDVAIVRARLEGALAVLGSATPSLESASNAQRGRYAHLTLKSRIFDRPMAAVEIVDMRQEYRKHGADVILSDTLVEHMRARLERSEQVVLLLNRRGFATVIFCRECGSSLECPHCSVSLTFHRAARRVRCHYCNYSAQAPTRCGTCGGSFLEQSGFGTERIETEVRARFPEARVARVDRDTIRRRGALSRVLRDVAAGGLDVVVGTQMIAKGHDFPSVTLAGIIAADVGLGLADFRASERTFQLLTQVIGRAGRGEVPGEAIIQTLYPDHYAIRAAADQDYPAFFEREMTFRTSMHYPPSTSLINVFVKGASLEKAMADALDLVARVRRHQPHGKVLGPAPAALSKIKDEYRAQFFVKGTHRGPMRSAVQRALAERTDLKRRTVVDVDPMNVI